MGKNGIIYLKKSPDKCKAVYEKCTLKTKHANRETALSSGEIDIVRFIIKD